MQWRGDFTSGGGCGGKGDSSLKGNGRRVPRLTRCSSYVLFNVVQV